MKIRNYSHSLAVPFLFPSVRSTSSASTCAASCQWKWKNECYPWDWSKIRHTHQISSQTCHTSSKFTYSLFPGSTKPHRDDVSRPSCVWSYCRSKSPSRRFEAHYMFVHAQYWPPFETYASYTSRITPLYIDSIKNLHTMMIVIQTGAKKFHEKIFSHSSGRTDVSREISSNSQSVTYHQKATVISYRISRFLELSVKNVDLVLRREKPATLYTAPWGTEI